ncbi:hypothetical protein PROFUN_07865 [Planoprotostelium fungivorum]|uniref:Uncharacterized protein n=1 Tax=Planoprotostelium fungivorum TaxID=1890364 RepID=A0A2P6NLC8_9EUKA|nr:hypothetical protein PROFUN_07865 [Planoprotostelium fungivorum]
MHSPQAPSFFIKINRSIIFTSFIAPALDSSAQHIPDLVCVVRSPTAVHTPSKDDKDLRGEISQESTPHKIHLRNGKTFTRRGSWMMRTILASELTRIVDLWLYTKYKSQQKQAVTICRIQMKQCLRNIAYVIDGDTLARND